jgi:RHS repeat-associated protein
VAGCPSAACSSRFDHTTSRGDRGDQRPRCRTLAPCTSSPGTVSSTYTKGFLTGVTGFASSLTYHPNQQVNQVTNANGVVTTYAMDPNHMARPASITTTSATPWSSGAYAYDGAGNVTRIGNGRFLYDGVSRLLQGVTVTTPADSTTTRTQTVAYDLYGNIQSITTNGSTLNTPTNSANRLTSSGTAYDAAGNLITWNWGNTYQYDPFGLLWHYTSGAEDWLYMYTADDQRVWAYRTGGSGNYWAIRDLDGKVLREYSTHAGWTVDRDYVYRGDKLLAAVTPQGTRHFHLDHLGSVRQVTNASAAQVAFHAYYPFGREATTLGQDNKEQMQFTGHERDLQNTTAGTNSDDLDYMHARYYNMHVGRFTSVDPARSWDPKAPQSWNRYGYALGNPIKYLDPDGRDAQLFIVDAGDTFMELGGHAALLVTNDATGASAGLSYNGEFDFSNGTAGFIDEYTGILKRAVTAITIKTDADQEQAMIKAIETINAERLPEDSRLDGLSQNNCSTACGIVLREGRVLPSDPIFNPRSGMFITRTPQEDLLGLIDTPAELFREVRSLSGNQVLVIKRYLPK